MLTGLTLINNLKHILGLPIFDKTKLVAFHLERHKENTVNGFHKKEKSESTHDLDSLSAIITYDYC
jgi:hypothetical protein